MSIGPGRPGEIEPPGHPIFGSAKEMKTHFALPRPVFESPLSRPARAIQRKAQTTDNCAEASPLSTVANRTTHSLKTAESS